MKEMVNKIYTRPEAEVVQTCAFQLMIPHSWDPDFVPDNPGPTLPIIEDDPTGDGKGANSYGLFDYGCIDNNADQGDYDPWADLK